MRRYIIAVVALVALNVVSVARADTPGFDDAGIADPPTTLTLDDSGDFATAPTVSTAPLPQAVEADPLGAVDRIRGLWRSGALPAALILAAFVALVVLRRLVPWFATGSRAVYVAAAIGGLGMLVEATAGGATPNASMLVVALTTTVALAMRPQAKGAA